MVTNDNKKTPKNPKKILKKKIVICLNNKTTIHIQVFIIENFNDNKMVTKKPQKTPNDIF